jgi:hypothetical protein
MGAAIDVRPAQYDHIREIPIPNGLNLPPLEEQFESEGWLMHNARTIRSPKTGEIIAMFGVKAIWPGVGHCFGIVTVNARQYMKTLVLAGREMVELASDPKFGFWRLQATVDVNFDRGIQYLVGLNFNIDGLMPQYGPNREDHLMMSRLIEWH